MTNHHPSAVLDVGSNTIRLLVARPENENLEPLLDRSEFVRLGAGVDATGRLQNERVLAAIGAIGRLAAEARSLHAAPLCAIATSAVRDAENGEAFVRRVQDETGVEVEIISGDREAYLTYLGASLGLDNRRGAVICDLGGGSAEVIAADETGMRWGRALQIGSGRLTERFVHHDPPTQVEREAVAAHVTEVLSGLPPIVAKLVIFTGGTASHVAWLAGLDGMIVHLDKGAFDRVVQLVTTEQVAEIVRRFGVNPERAQVLPAGVLALQALARFYQAEDVTITRHGIREGALVDRLRREGKWPVTSGR